MPKVRASIEKEAELVGWGQSLHERLNLIDPKSLQNAFIPMSPQRPRSRIRSFYELTKQSNVLNLLCKISTLAYQDLSVVSICLLHQELSFRLSRPNVAQVFNKKLKNCANVLILIWILPSMRCVAIARCVQYRSRGVIQKRDARASLIAAIVNLLNAH